MRERERWTNQVKAGGAPSARPSFLVRVHVYKQKYVPEERCLIIRARASVLHLPVPDAELVVHAHHDG